MVAFNFSPVLPHLAFAIGVGVGVELMSEKVLSWRCSWRFVVDGVDEGYKVGGPVVDVGVAFGLVGNVGEASAGDV